MRRLRYFLAVADHHHFGRAAGSLNVSATALSEQIRKLETELGVRLFDRNPRGAQLTDIGVEVAEQARVVVQDARLLGDVVDRHRRRSTATIRLGFVTLAAGDLTPQIVAQCEREGDGRHSVDVVHLDYTQQLQAVLAHEVDVSIARGPAHHPQLRIVVIATEPRAVMLSSEHPLAGRPFVQCPDLKDEVRVDTDGVPDAWRRWWSLDPSPDGSRPPYGPVVHSFDEQLELAAAGVAISIVPETAAHIYRRSDVSFVTITDAEPSEILLCARADDESPRVRQLLAAWSGPESNGKRRM